MKLLNIFIFLFIYHLTFSQEKLKWGQLSQDEINLTKVSFEPDADAVILKDEGDLFITKKGYTLEQYCKIKILSTNGYEYAQKKWRYYTGNNYDNITFEEGHTINIVDGKEVITPVNKSDLFITDINSNTKEISVAFPNVNVGSIIEYKIKTIIAFNGYSNVWNFQNNLPTLSSVLTKKNSSFGEILLYGEYLNKKYKKKHRTKWELNNIPSTKSYSLVYNPNDYRDRIALQDSYSDNDSWKRFIKIISSEIDKSSAKTNFNAIASKIPNGNNKLETLQNCIRYIQENFKWDEVYEVVPGNLNEHLLRNKSGNTADLNVLLNKILKAKNIEAELIVNSNRDNGRIVMIYPVLTGIQTILNLVTIDQSEQILIDVANSDPKKLRYLSLDFFNIIAARINNPNKIFITNYPILSEHLSQQVLDITPKKTELKIKDNYRGYFEQKTIDNLTGSLIGNLRYEDQEESLDEWKVKRRIYELENINFFTFENRFIDLIKSISIEKDRKQPIEINFPFQHIVQIKTNKKPEEYQFHISNFNIEISAFEGQLKYIQKSEETDNDVILTWQLLVAKSFFTTNEIEEYYNFIETTKEATQHSAILKKI